MQKIKNNPILKGATFLGLGAFFSKILGAIYRVPLTNLLGGYGLGLYQMVFPVYSLLLDFSGAGVPSALSGLIASEEEREKSAYNYLISSIKLLFFIGIIGSLFMLILARPLSLLQGNGMATLSYVSLAPAVFAVSLISCLRGYFQGQMNMVPTAISQIIEQVVKLSMGLLFVNLFLPNVEKAVAGATLAITFSEFIALFVLYSIYTRDKKVRGINFSYDKQNQKQQIKKIIKTTVPITLIGIAIPLSHVIDSFLTINILSTYRADATALYGLLFGVVHTVINLPVSICYGVSTVAIPAVSSAKTHLEKSKKTKSVIFLTLLLSIPCAVFCLLFSPFVINFLFRSLSIEEKLVAVNLLKLTCPSIILLSLVQTTNAVLIGKNKHFQPLLSLGVGVMVKTVLNIVLLSVPSINIYGGGVGLNACYFIACLINLIMIFKLKVKNVSKTACCRQYAS